MDSGNSTTLQSSTGGQGGAFSADVNLPTNFNHTPILQSSSNFFDPSSFSQPPNPNPMYNLDSLWSKTSNATYDPEDTDDPNPNFGPEKLGMTTKNPKKRTRASRRAPTTVLTTDTTNFRQMVQEFTGIPAAPFSASRRLDLYSGSVAPMQPVRPSAQKIVHLSPSETHGFTKQPLNLSNLANLSSNSSSRLQNEMFPLQVVSQATMPQRLEASDAFMSSSSTSMKRWRGESENLLNFEGVSGNLQNAVVSSSDGDQRQLQGNGDSWSF